MLAVRKIALSKFGLVNLPSGAPAADLKRVLAPIYLFHRYQVEAAVKLIGGVDYSYAVRGDGHEVASIPSAATQRKALDALLLTTDPATLDLPDPLLNLLSSGQSGVRDKAYEIEIFPTSGPAVFDLPTAAEMAADQTVSLLLNPQRLNRVVEQNRRDPAQLGVAELAERLLAGVAPSKAEGRLGDLRRRIRARVVGDLVEAQGDKALSPTAAVQIDAALRTFGKTLAAYKGGGAEGDQAAALSRALLSDDIAVRQALAAPRSGAVESLPPGMPIGGEDCWFCAPSAGL